MIEYRGGDWLKVMFRVRGSVAPRLVGRVVVATAVGAVASRAFDEDGFRVAPIAHTMVGVALSLLLVFRTNASYERYWEGRRLLGQMTNLSRNLLRHAAVYLEGTDRTSQANREEIGRLIVASFRLMMQSLRSETDLSPLSGCLTEAERLALEPVQNRSSVVATWVLRRIVGHPHPPDAIRILSMDSMLSAWIDAIGGCERIRKTPVPFAYAQHIKIFVFVFVYTAPFAIVDAMRWHTPVAAGLLALALFGIEEIGTEIEDPFGYDPNDLPLEAIADAMDGCTREILGTPEPAASSRHLSSAAV